MSKNKFLNFLKSSSLEELLKFAENKFKDLVFEPISIGSYKLDILQFKDLESYIDSLVNLSSDTLELPFWAKIWPSSLLLSFYIQRLKPNSKHMLEVGCGVGVCGLFAAAHGFKVTLTDISEEALLFSQINILKNNLINSVDIGFVDFTSSVLDRKYDIILGSEVLYVEKNYEPFYKFLLNHITDNGEIIIAKEPDIKAELFFKLAKESFNIKEKTIGLKSSDERYLCTIYRLTPKT